MLVALLMLLAIYGVGRALRRLVRLKFWSQAADLAYAFAFGLGALAVALFGLALVGALRPPTGWALLVGGVALALLQHRLLRSDLGALADLLRSGLRASWFVKVLALLALAFVLANLVADLAPPIEGDTVHQYLLAPRYWVEAGRYVQPAHIWASTLPGNMMMLSAWALLLRPGFSLPTLVTGLGMSALFALGVYALARPHFGRSAAALAALVIYTVPDVSYLAQSAKVDMGWAFFETLALAAFLRWIESPVVSAKGREASSAAWLALAGACLGLAAGSKNQTFISIALLGLWLALRLALRRDWRGLAQGIFTFGLAALATGFPYYLYNGIVHHNPFYPVFANTFVRLFGATPSPRSELGTEVFYPWTVGGYLANLWNASLGHTRPGFYLGFIAGPVFLLAIPAGWALGFLRGKRAAWRMLGYAFAFSIVWFLVKQAVRHFLPGLVLLAAVAGLVLWKLDQQQTALRRVTLGLVILAVAWNLMSSLGVLYWSGAYRVASGMESRAAFIERFHDEVLPPTFPDAETLDVLNTQVGAGGRVLTAHASSPLYAAPDIVSTNWGNRESFQDIADPDVLLDKLLAHRIEYVLVYTADPGEAGSSLSALVSRYAVPVYEGPRTQLYRIEAREQ
jgi:4-amino-4-deoxy-L-arabinose transferase-like glycosyltransferase